MRRRLLAFIAGAVLLPAVAAGSAAADDPLVQGAGQSAFAIPVSNAAADTLSFEARSAAMATPAFSN